MKKVELIAALSLSLSLHPTHICVIWTTHHQEAYGRDMWYLKLDQNIFLELFESIFTFLVLYSPMVPISLYVTLEFVRVFQAGFIQSDIEMFHQETNTPALARYARKSCPLACLCV